MLKLLQPCASFAFRLHAMPEYLKGNIYISSLLGRSSRSIVVVQGQGRKTLTKTSNKDISQVS